MVFFPLDETAVIIDFEVMTESSEIPYKRQVGAKY
jgi:hypothetical protein